MIHFGSRTFLFPVTERAAGLTVSLPLQTIWASASSSATKTHDDDQRSHNTKPLCLMLHLPRYLKKIMWEK